MSQQKALASDVITQHLQPQQSVLVSGGCDSRPLLDLAEIARCLGEKTSWAHAQNKLKTLLGKQCDLISGGE